MITLILQFLLAPNVWEWHAPPPVEMEAYITSYSVKESCHHPNCLNASNKKPEWGDVACPRWLELGTRLKIIDQIFTCRDRYALWLDKERNLPTFDIFAGYGIGAYEDAINFGKQKMKIQIIN